MTANQADIPSTAAAREMHRESHVWQQAIVASQERHGPTPIYAAVVADLGNVLHRSEDET